MKWRDVEISKLTDNELREAILSVVDIDKNRLDKLDKPRKRHKYLFNTHAPVENPVFIQLATELNNEFKNRKLDNV